MALPMALHVVRSISRDTRFLFLRFEIQHSQLIKKKRYTATKLRARHLSLAEGDSLNALSNAALNSKVPHKEKWS
jgi:hypothetical protein